MSTEWREMEAGRKLDAIIAEQLGWKLVHQQDKYIPYYVIDPNGVMPAPALPVTSPDQAWALALASRDGIPAYSTSVDAALTLLDGFEWNVCMYANGTYMAFLKNASLTLHTPIDPETRTPALAICRAWLEWRDSQTN